MFKIFLREAASWRFMQSRPRSREAGRAQGAKKDRGNRFPGPSPIAEIGPKDRMGSMEVSYQVAFFSC